MTKKLLRIITVLLLISLIVVSCTSSKDFYICLPCNGDTSWWLVREPIAHRGLHDKKHPENSISAFKKAVKSNYPIELDVQFTKDKKVVVFHDDSLKRLTKDQRKVNEVEYKELKRLKLLDTSKKIPLFKDVLKVVAGKVPILVEIKSCKNVDELTEAVNSILSEYEGEYAVESFDKRVINWYNKNAPDVKIGLLTNTIDNAALNYLDRIDFIATNMMEIKNYKAQQIRRLGFPIIGWTIRDEEEKVRVEKYCDNYIFDYFALK